MFGHLLCDTILGSRGDSEAKASDATSPVPRKLPGVRVVSERKPMDRRDGWGPQCDAHSDFLKGLVRLESALYWIRVFVGGILGSVIAGSIVMIPLVVQMNRNIETVLHDHGDRLTKLEQKHEIMDKFFKPLGE